MPISRKSVRAIALLCVILFVAVRVGVVRDLKDAARPSGEGRRVESSAAGVSPSAWLGFLNRDFNIVTDVNALPGPVLQKYTEPGGSRLRMANPGQEFNASDSRDPGMPSERLLFAGLAGDLCFVHYEKGGKPYLYVVEFFGGTSSASVEPLWSGYCDTAAANVQELRSEIIHGGCSHPRVAR
jgi:hypothetical protein